MAKKTAKPAKDKASKKALGKAGKKDKAPKVAKPTPPSVNLLPPRLEFEKTKQVTKRGMLIVSIGFVVSCLVLLGGQLILNHFAQSAVDVQQDKITAVEEKLAGYDNIKDFLATIEKRENTIATLQGNQLNYVTISNAVLDELPTGSSIQSLSINLLEGASGDAVERAAKCGTVVDPIGIQSAVIVGCLKTTVSVPVGTDAAAFTSRLSASEYLVNVDVSSVRATTDGAEPVVEETFTVTASVVQSGLLRMAPVEDVSAPAAAADASSESEE